MDSLSNPTLDDFPRFELYQHEAFSGGSAAAERAEFRAHVRKMQALQRRQAARSDHTPRRVFHAKSHGALLGELRLRPDRPPETRRGLFADAAPESYPVLARFSNASGAVQSDALPDVRGIALRVFDPAAGRQMDLLMSNSPIPFGRNAADFVEFGIAGLNPASLLEFLTTHPGISAALIRAVALPPLGGITTVTFWSGHAYLLEPERAMKLKLAPALDERERLRRIGEVLNLLHDPDFLGADLKDRAGREEIRFTLSIQLESGDPDRTPVENTLVEWKEEDSPPIAVADLLFPRQKITDAANQLVEGLAFNAWNHLPEHRPLGNMARGRLFSYLASAAGRNARPNPGYAEFRAQWDRAAGPRRTAAARRG